MGRRITLFFICMFLLIGTLSAYTDDNTGENLIISTDSEYYSSTGHYITVEFEIDNAAAGQYANIKFPMDSDLELIELNKLERFINFIPINILKNVDLRDTEVEEIIYNDFVYSIEYYDCIAKIDDKTLDRDSKISKCYDKYPPTLDEVKTGKYKDKDRDKSIIKDKVKDTKGYISNLTGNIYLDSGKNIFKAVIKVPIGYEGEFFIEALGEYGDYGHLDPYIQFDPPTLENNDYTKNNWTEINVTITEANLEEVIYNWNGTNYSFYDDNLILMMNFDNVSALGENDTLAVDVSRYGNNGTIVGGATWNSSGKYNGDISLDGAGDYVDINSLSDNLPLNDFAISSWVKMDAQVVNSYIIALQSQTSAFKGINVFISPVGYIRSYVGNGTTGPTISSPTSSYNFGEWNYITFQRSGDNVSLWQDGVYLSSSILSGTLAYAPTRPIIIGGFVSGNFNGSIDEFRIWNRSLSDSEIQESYMSNLRKYDTDKWELYVNQTQSPNIGLSDGTYTYQAWATDTGTSTNTTGERLINIGGDVVPPTYSNGQFNQTYTGIITQISLDVNDNFILETNGTYIFSTNNTGEWINESAINFTSTPETITLDFILNDTIGNYICFSAYVTDNAGNENFTAIEYCTTTLLQLPEMKWFIRDKYTPTINMTFYSDATLQFTPVANPLYSCSSLTEGRQYYDSALHEYCYCNGTNWRQFDSADVC